MLFGYIRYEYIVYSTVVISLGIVSVIIDPANSTILTDNTVFDVIQILTARPYLIIYRIRNCGIIIRMYFSFLLQYCSICAGSSES